jgi:hypothetical protein
MRAAALLILVGAACGENPPFEIDTFPMSVDLSAGPLAIDADIPGIGRRHVILDTGSPVTLVGAANRERRVVTINLKNGAATRARFDLVSAILVPLGQVGTDPPIDVGGIVGGDVLSRIAFRIDPVAGSALLFPAISGSNAAHEDACDAVFPVSIGGGGQYVIGDEQVLYQGTRIVIPACTGSAADAALGPTGKDASFLLATGVGRTVLARSAWKRITGASDADIDALPTTMLFLGGTTGVTVAAATLPDLELVAREADERGPCLELYLSRILSSLASCPQTVMDGFGLQCTCTGDNPDCSAGASAELRREVPVVILDDANPLLQGIRNELRPNFAEVDGLIGMETLRAFLLDIDYPGSRLIFRCAGGTCKHRPHIDGDNRDRARDLSARGCFQ